MKRDEVGAKALVKVFEMNARGIALIDAISGHELDYSQLWELVEAGSRKVGSDRKKLAYLQWGNDIGAVLCYLSLLKAEHAVWIGREASAWGQVIAAYAPDLVLWNSTQNTGPSDGGYRTDPDLMFGYAIGRCGPGEGEVFESLALLLQTSGSSGIPKAARLSYKNMAASALQSSSAIELTSGARVASTTPLHHIYGLTLLHSALAVGATLILHNRSVLDRQFWNGAAGRNLEVLACVPATLDLIQSAKVDPMACGIRKITSSGAALSNRTQAWLGDIASRGLKVYSMYGATEACGRMCVLPSEDFLLRPSSVGRPVAGGDIRLLESGEVAYRGDNVALGYASCRRDLRRRDENRSLLRTGDIGRLDSEGYLYLTGRISRICKILGVRISLDDVEADLSNIAPVAAVGNDLSITIYRTAYSDSEAEEQVQMLARRLRVPPNLFKTARISSLPRTASGKVAYGSLPILTP